MVAPIPGSLHQMTFGCQIKYTAIKQTSILYSIEASEVDREIEAIYCDISITVDSPTQVATTEN